MNVACTPMATQMRVAITEPSTDVAPFIPQSHGANLVALLLAANIPSGRAIPIKKPGIDRTTADNRILTNRGEPAVLAVINGVATATIANVTTAKTRRSQSRSFSSLVTVRLPRPEDTKRVKSTSEAENRMAEEDREAS